MCGIIGIYNFDKKNDIINETLERMSKLQHRGKDSFGISFKIEDSHIKSLKKKGMINDFKIESDKNIISCLGHLKYRTSNMNDIEKGNIQPVCNDILSIAHNGNIPNVDGFDTNYIYKIITDYNGTFKNALINLIKTIPASYSLVIQYKESLYILKDRYGIRPLSYGFKGNNTYISSETYGLVGCNNIREVDSGEIIEIDKRGIRQIYKHDKTFDNICAFEFIYFMNPCSFYKNIMIESIRKDLIKKLTQKEKMEFSKDYIVVGVPNSGIVYGEEYSNILDLEYRQLINKNTDERTFISPTQEEIKKTCHKKFTYDRENIKGKKIIVIDDTIVRGNVMNYICDNLRDCGAKEIHVRIPSPPVVDICQLGIPINNKDNLLMNNHTIESALNALNINSLIFLEIEDLDVIPFDTYKECFGGGIKGDIVSFLKK